MGASGNNAMPCLRRRRPAALPTGQAEAQQGTRGRPGREADGVERGGERQRQEAEADGWRPGATTETVHTDLVGGLDQVIAVDVCFGADVVGAADMLGGQGGVGDFLGASHDCRVAAV